jgi:hypothetical protein
MMTIASIALPAPVPEWRVRKSPNRPGIEIQDVVSQGGTWASVANAVDRAVSRAEHFGHLPQPPRTVQEAESVRVQVAELHEHVNDRFDEVFGRACEAFSSLSRGVLKIIALYRLPGKQPLARHLATGIDGAAEALAQLDKIARAKLEWNGPTRLEFEQSLSLIEDAVIARAG